MGNISRTEQLEEVYAYNGKRINSVFQYHGIGQIVSAQDHESEEYVTFDIELVRSLLEDTGVENTPEDYCEIGRFRYCCSYRPSAREYFKRFLQVVEKCNPGIFSIADCTGDEQQLIGLWIGIILGEKEYYALHGEVRKSLQIIDVFNFKEEVIL